MEMATHILTHMTGGAYSAYCHNMKDEQTHSVWWGCIKQTYWVGTHKLTDM